MRVYSPVDLTLSLPVTGICINISTVYNDMLVAKGLTGNMNMIVSGRTGTRDFQILSFPILSPTH